MADMNVCDLVRTYFMLGFQQREILHSLATNNGVVLSLRTLQRLLRKCGLYRRGRESDILDVALFVTDQVEKSGQLHGYRMMHLKCLHQGFCVTQTTVLSLMHIIDPNGVETRKRKRLRRRQYHNVGPNYVWHIDGYDKLKPFGICIHGAIDGFSRTVLWLNAYRTNNDPKVIAGYFIEKVSSIMGCPKRVRADLGTENVYVEQMQKFCRYAGGNIGEQTTIYGTSVHNQRIESWWSILRRQNAQYWIELFKMLKESGQFRGDFLDKNIIRFCFMKIIQRELDEVVKLWNCHRISPSRQQVAPHGRPLVMYQLPHLYHTTDQMCPVTADQVRICREECSMRDEYPCDPDVFELCCLVMTEKGLSSPEDGESAVVLYETLRRVIMEGLENH